VADSRCVCATRDGNLWVWDLESGMGVRAAAIRSTHIPNPSETSMAHSDYEECYGTVGRPPAIVRVAFDAQRIVAVDINDMLHTYSFDI
jgi:hypothetical protein